MWAEADAEETRQISIHALREEGDRSASYRASPSGYFYPRPPRGGRHDPKRVGGQKDVFLSTPSARRATLWPTSRSRPSTNFYPRPPRGGRPNSQPLSQVMDLFLSTPSARRATCSNSTDVTALVFLSTPSARRATRDYVDRVDAYQFLSTPSARRATARRSVHPQRSRISIHALREEGDEQLYVGQGRGEEFLSTPSARRATKAAGQIAKLMQFLSTPSARRATAGLREVGVKTEISIHALREEGDPCGLLRLLPFGYFYPRPPRGGRRFHCPASPSSTSISIHALREEGDGSPRPLDP